MFKTMLIVVLASGFHIPMLSGTVHADRPACEANLKAKPNEAEIKEAVKVFEKSFVSKVLSHEEYCVTQKQFNNVMIWIRGHNQGIKVTKREDA